MQGSLSQRFQTRNCEKTKIYRAGGRERPIVVAESLLRVFTSTRENAGGV